MIKETLNEKNIPEIDYFYMDLNGIIYRCVQDESMLFKDFLTKKDFEDIWLNIMNQISCLVSIAAPRKCVFITFDGVAPKAKMNHQRGRRFKSAKSSAESQENFKSCGLTKESDGFRSTSISPGTEFMNDLNDAIHFMILKKMEEDENWKKMKVIFSGANVPGEGEHKIMDFIRVNKPKFLASDSHCVYSSDADMILLTLISGLDNVMIMRDPISIRPKILKSTKRNFGGKQFEAIFVSLLREYMAIEYGMLRESLEYLEYDINRILEDFLALCNFVGNDFLPRLYTFQIRTGRFDTLIESFKKFLMTSKSYICEDGIINFKAFQYLVELIVPKELEFLNCKLQDVNKYLGFLRVTKQKAKQISHRKGNNLEKNLEEFGPTDSASESEGEVEKDIIPEFLQNKQIDVLMRERDYLERFLIYLKESPEGDELLDAKRFYYQEKLEINIDDKESGELIRDMCINYLQGIQFVQLYYHSGVPSWNWTYNHHYSPMLTDVLAVMKDTDFNSMGGFKFPQSVPFEPFKQLLLILHPDDSTLLPPSIQDIVRESELRNPVDYYPSEFEIDPFGGVFDSEFIALIPFVPDEVLERVYNSIDKTKFTEKEKSRNSLYPTSIYEFDSQTKNAVVVKSFIPNIFPNIKIAYKKNDFLGLIPTIPKPSKEELENLNLNFKKFTTLMNLKSLSAKIEKAENRKSKYQVVKIEIPPNPHDPAFFFEKKTFKEDYLDLVNDDIVYFGFPHQYECSIMAVLTPEKPLYRQESAIISSYSGLEYKKAFSYAVDAAMKEIDSSVYKINHKIQTVLIIKEYNYFAKNCDGTVFRDYVERIYPIELVSFKKTIKYKKDFVDIQSISEEFKIGSKFVSLESRSIGSIGEIKSNVPPPNKRFKLFYPEFKILQIPDFSQDSIIKTNIEKKEKSSKFYEINSLVKDLAIDKMVLICLFSTFEVISDSKTVTSLIIPPKVELGLNVIDLKKFRLVSELVHLKNLKKPNKNLKFTKKEFVDDLEISETVIENLKELKSEFPELINKLTEKVKSDEFVIRAKDLFPELNDPNLGVLRIYEWIVKRKISYLYFRTPWTKVTSLLFQTLPLHNFVELEKSIKMKNKIMGDSGMIFKLDPNQMFPIPTNKYFHPFYTGHPAMQEIGDHVININTKSDVHIPFGLSGYVVGVLGRELVEIVFDEPFIGGTTLGGKCSKGMGAVVHNLDVFNPKSCNKIGLRYSNRDLAWDGYMYSFVPQFKNQSVIGEKPKEEVKEETKNETIEEEMKINTRDERKKNQKNKSKGSKNPEYEEEKKKPSTENFKKQESKGHNKYSSGQFNEVKTLEKDLKKTLNINSSEHPVEFSKNSNKTSNPSISQKKKKNKKPQAANAQARPVATEETLLQRDSQALQKVLSNPTSESLLQILKPETQNSGSKDSNEKKKFPLKANSKDFMPSGNK